MKLLNLGCGTRFHAAWINIDCVATDSTVLVHDLRKGIPFPSDEFDVVYHSHLLEHLSRSNVTSFLHECFRVLKPGGALRVAVPDLERIAKAYLQALDEALQGASNAKENHEWMMLELYDQTVREVSGGGLSDYLFRENISNKEFVLNRIGIEAQQAFDNLEQERNKAPATGPDNESRRSILRRLSRLILDPAARSEAIIRRLLGPEYELLQLGRFRRRGEIHLWMYDRYSLARLLREAGFEQPQVLDATQSRIPNWKEYNLDTAPDGTVYKPDSLFMEAGK